MKITIKKGVSLLLLLFTLSSLQSANAEAIALPWKKEHSDALRVFQFLNYIDLALAETIKTEDSLILARNYDILSDNIDLAEVKDEQVINVIEALGKLVDRTQTDRLTEQVIDIYRERLTESIYSGIETSGSLQRSILKEIPRNPSTWSDYRVNRNIYKERLDQETKITSKQLREITELRKEMLRISWELFNKYEVGKGELLSSSYIDRFIGIIDGKDPILMSRQLRRLLKDQPSFESFPPFWFNYGMAEKGQNNPARNSFALTCFDRYIGTYRGIFKKDPTLVITGIERISLLPAENRVQRIKNLEITKENASSVDWQSFAFSAIINGQMGLIPQAKEDLQRNIDDSKEVSLCSRLMGELLLEARDFRGFQSVMMDAVNDTRIKTRDILSLVPHCRAVKCRDWITTEVLRLNLSIAGSNEWISRITIPDSWIDAPCTLEIEISGENINQKTEFTSTDITAMLPNEKRDGRLIEISLSEDIAESTIPQSLTIIIDHSLYSLSTDWRLKKREEGLGQDIKLTLGKIMTFYKPEIAQYEMTDFSISGRKFQLIEPLPEIPAVEKKTEESANHLQELPEKVTTEKSEDRESPEVKDKDVDQAPASLDIALSQDLEKKHISTDIEKSSMDSDLDDSHDELTIESKDIAPEKNI